MSSDFVVAKAVRYRRSAATFPTLTVVPPAMGGVVNIVESKPVMMAALFYQAGHFAETGMPVCAIGNDLF